MVALYRSGRQAEASRAYQAGYAALADIGLRPGHELRAIAESVSREDPALQLAARSAAATVNVPVPGEDDWCELVDREPGVSALRRPTRQVRRAGAGGGGAVVRAEPCCAVGRRARRPARTNGRRGAGAPARREHGLRALAPIVARRPAGAGYRSSLPTVSILRGGARPARRPFRAGARSFSCWRTSTVRAPLRSTSSNTSPDVEAMPRSALVAACSTTFSGGTFDAWLLRLERDGLRSPGLVSRPRITSSGRVSASDEQPVALDRADLAADAFCRRGEVVGACWRRRAAAPRLRGSGEPLSSCAHRPRPDGGAPDLASG